MGSKKLHKADFFALTAIGVGPITPLIERGGAVASGGRVARSGVMVLTAFRLAPRYQFLPHLCGNSEPGFDRDVGSGRRGFLRLVFDIVG